MNKGHYLHYSIGEHLWVQNINERNQILTQDVSALCTLKNTSTDFLEEVRRKLKFHYWIFGHYHDNRNIGNNFVLLYEQIVQVI